MVVLVLCNPQDQIIVGRPKLEHGKVSPALVADAREARRWANSLLAGVPNADAEAIQALCSVGWAMAAVCQGCMLVQALAL